MRISGDTWQEAYGTFRWEIPERFNLAEVLCDRHAARDPAATAMIVEEGDGSARTWTFADLDRAASRTANVLRARGVGPGVIVAIQLPQCAETAIAHIAVQKTGAIALPLFNLFGPEAVRYRLSDSGAQVLVTSAGNFERLADDLADVEGLRHVLTVDGAGPRGAKDFWGEIAHASDRFTTAETGRDDPAILMYTSGTTGNPKGVLHAARVVPGHLPGVIVPHSMMPQPGDRYWTPADWAWAGGLLDVLLPSLYLAVPVIGSKRTKFDPDWAFAFMAKHAIRNVFMPPTALRLMRAVPEPTRRHAYRLRSLASGGETLGADLIAWGRETFGLEIAEFFGQTEANLVVGNGPTLFPVRPGSMGRALPGHVVEVVDDVGNVLAPGTPGIVAVRRPDPVMFLEYWRRPEATAEKFRGDWCLLGDVATKDEDGYFWFRGRDDDIISSAGYRIGPGEVEECLTRHPAVALAGVVGSPDAIRGEVVAAFVVLRDGFTPSDTLATEIQAFVKNRLAAHEYPRKLRFIDEMPVTITGKVRRIDLRKLDRDGGM
ncbi:MAG: AMP-binding protein [Hyphomicrobiaceae bacterium]